MTIRFGPAGLGPVKDATKNLEEYYKLGFRACEIAFTYGVYIKNEEDIKAIKESAERLDIKLSIHAPYFVNLNSKDPAKIESSKKRILDCCETGEKLGCSIVVFHPGYYNGVDEQKTYENIKNAILDIQEIIKNKEWKIKIAPETMGKISVFGSFEQIGKLKKDTECEFCIDFAHILARDKIVNYPEIKKLFKEKNWHCHFTGIVYGEKGEKHHKKTEKKDWEDLIKELPKDKEITIINESPSMIEDSIEGLNIYKKMTNEK
ncbi:MAG: TIM barrel protein, partial [Nanoarchaeota archaeon]